MITLLLPGILAYNCMHVWIMDRAGMSICGVHAPVSGGGSVDSVVLTSTGNQMTCLYDVTGNQHLDNSHSIEIYVVPPVHKWTPRMCVWCCIIFVCCGTFIDTFYINHVKVWFDSWVAEDGKSHSIDRILAASITPWRLHSSQTTLILSIKTSHCDIISINLSHAYHMVSKQWSHFRKSQGDN